MAGTEKKPPIPPKAWHTRDFSKGSPPEKRVFSKNSSRARVLKVATTQHFFVVAVMPLLLLRCRHLLLHPPRAPFRPGRGGRGEAFQDFASQHLYPLFF